MGYEEDPTVPLLSRAEVARHLRVSDRTMRRYLADGRLVGGVGEPPRFSRAEVERFRQELGGEWIQPPLPGMEYIGIPVEQVVLTPQRRELAESLLAEVSSQR